MLQARQVCAMASSSPVVAWYSLRIASTKAGSTLTT
jgi:hypothetical protein